MATNRRTSTKPTKAAKPSASRRPSGASRTAKATGKGKAVVAKASARTAAKAALKPTRTNRAAPASPAPRPAVTVPNAATQAPAGNAASVGQRTPQSITPYLTVGGAAKAVDWYKQVFGAKELSRMPLPNGKLMHCHLRFGDSDLFVADAFQGPVPTKMVGVTIHHHLKSGIDQVWERAIRNGATVEMPLGEQFWGDRYGQIRDPFGHLWSLGMALQMTDEEKQRLEKKAMSQASNWG